MHRTASDSWFGVLCLREKPFFCKAPQHRDDVGADCPAIGGVLGSKHVDDLIDIPKTVTELQNLYRKLIRCKHALRHQNHPDLPRLVEFYLRGDLDLDLMVAEEIRLDGINGALDALRQGDSVRSVIRFD